VGRIEILTLYAKFVRAFVTTLNRVELLVIAEKWTLSKPSDEADYSGFHLPHSIKGWALIAHKQIVLFRRIRGKRTPSPS
jgi:hypothetical protein